MSLYKLIHFVFGEYRFQTDEKYFPRLATELARRRLNFWDSEYSEEKVLFRASVFAAEEITECAKEQSIPIKIVSKRGIPFIFSRYRKRYGLISGLAIGLLLLLYSQLFVWKIEISGNNLMTDSEVELALSECGITVGSFIPRIDPSADANRLLMSCRELSSAAISLDGTHLKLSLLERVEIPDIVDESGFYNVVATHSGMILDIDAADGTPEVNEGDAVYEGQLLINSFIEGRNGSFRPTHARGIVYAAVEKSFISEIPYERLCKEYTGNSETKKIYRVLGWELPSFSNGATDYEYFDCVATERDIVLFGFIELPIREYSMVYTEYRLKKQLISESEAEIIARESLSDRLAELDCEVLSCDVIINNDKENGVCRLEAKAVLKQNIAREVPFELINYKISERFNNARE